MKLGIQCSSLQRHFVIPRCLTGVLTENYMKVNVYAACMLHEVKQRLPA